MKKAKLSILIIFLACGLLSFGLTRINQVCAAGLIDNQVGLKKGDVISQVFTGTSGKTQDLREMAVTLIKIFLGLLGLYFTILIIMAGFKWMNSRGNDEQVKEAKSQLKNAIIGMIIIIAAYAITELVVIYAECIVEGDCEW